MGLTSFRKAFWLRSLGKNYLCLCQTEEQHLSEDFEACLLCPANNNNHNHNNNNNNTEDDNEEDDSKEDNNKEDECGKL